jgi:hypothetical protein
MYVCTLYVRGRSLHSTIFRGFAADLRLSRLLRTYLSSLMRDEPGRGAGHFLGIDGWGGVVERHVKNKNAERKKGGVES